MSQNEKIKNKNKPNLKENYIKLNYKKCELKKKKKEIK
jgi:hypothetical protein